MRAKQTSALHRVRLGALVVASIVALSGCATASYESIDLAMEIVDTELEVRRLEDELAQLDEEYDELLELQGEADAELADLESEARILAELSERINAIAYPEGWIRLRGPSGGASETPSNEAAESSATTEQTPTTSAAPAPNEDRPFRGNRQYVLGSTPSCGSLFLLFDGDSEVWTVSNERAFFAKPADELPLLSQPPLPPSWANAPLEFRDSIPDTPRMTSDGTLVWQITFGIDTSKVYNSNEFFPVASFFLGLNVDECSLSPLRSEWGSLSGIWQYQPAFQTCFGLLDEVDSEPDESEVCEQPFERPDGELLLGASKLRYALPSSTVRWEDQTLEIAGILNW